MPSVNQDLVKSGFDVEALLGANYFRMLIQTAMDAGEFAASFVQQGEALAIHSVPPINRLYEATADPPGSDVPASGDAFETEILFNHPTGANLRVRLKLEPPNFIAVPFDLMIKITFDPAHVIDGVPTAAVLIDGVDIEAAQGIFDEIFRRYGKTKDDLLLLMQEKLNRPIPLGASSKFKRVEKIEIAWHEADAEHDAALGIYINVFLRNGDEDNQFVAPRGDLAEGRNFLPAGEDIAMATRPGLYSDLAKDVFSRSALKRSNGVFDHILRPNILSPTSKDIGLVHRIQMGQAFGPGHPNPLPINGLRLRMEAEYRDPTDLTLTDIAVTIDIKPQINGDGTLSWDTDFDVSVDALFEFLTLWGTMLTFILSGPIGAGIFLGAVLVGQAFADIYLGEHFDARVSNKADATLSDVIPDRLGVKTRRWDPFYSTQHQVVVKPSQAQFNAVGFMLCGKAFVGRELTPPQETVIRDDFRDADGKITAVRYRVSDFEKVAEDRAILALGRHDRPFDPPDSADPDLFALTVDQYAARATDPDGKLIHHPIPYFVAYVHREDNTIRHVLVISGTELAEMRQEHRAAETERVRAQITADEGPEIRQEVIDELSANGGTPTEEEIGAEVQRRIEQRVTEEMNDFEAPTPLDMVFSGELKTRVRWELTPQEMFELVNREMVSVDTSLRFIKGPNGKIYLRDVSKTGFENQDNLRQRPQYKPGPGGPVFND